MDTSSKRFLLGLGCGQSGLRSLAGLLHRQSNTAATHMEWPLLSWPNSFEVSESDRLGIVKLASIRMQRIADTRIAEIVADSASFYLPYTEAILDQFPTASMICLKRDRNETMDSFCKWLDTYQRLPTDHWSKSLQSGWYRDPVWSRIYPKMNGSDRSSSVGAYYDLYYTKAQQLAAKYPQRFRIFDMHAVLNTYQGQLELLEYCGYRDPQVILPAKHAEAPMAPRSAPNAPLDPSRCIVLVPYMGHILPECDRSLRELERRNYQVWRVGGYAAIDQARNQLATDALIDGFEETMWIDSDIAFDPSSVDLLRSHNLPLVSGLYAKKGQLAVASYMLPNQTSLALGKSGGLEEIQYAATGFLHVRREVYEAMQEQLQLPVCNEHFRKPVIPFFEPLIKSMNEGSWYLGEDYAFSERVRKCGFKVVLDSSIRLWHIGEYPYGWEDAGTKTSRYESYQLNFCDKKS